MTKEYSHRPKAPVLNWVPANEVDLLSGEQIRDRLRTEVRELQVDGQVDAAYSTARLSTLIDDVRSVLDNGGPASEGLIVVAAWLVGLREAGVDHVPLRTLTALADAIEVGVMAWPGE
ncbi:hypothetical protein GCM10027447_38890 [Glycomyces halotolerans]